MKEFTKLATGNHENIFPIPTAIKYVNYEYHNGPKIFTTKANAIINPVRIPVATLAFFLRLSPIKITIE